MPFSKPQDIAKNYEKSFTSNFLMNSMKYHFHTYLIESKFILKGICWLKWLSQYSLNFIHKEIQSHCNSYLGIMETIIKESLCKLKLG